MPPKKSTATAAAAGKKQSKKSSSATNSAHDQMEEEVEEEWEYEDEGNQQEAYEVHEIIKRRLIGRKKKKGKQSKGKGKRKRSSGAAEDDEDEDEVDDQSRPPQDYEYLVWWKDYPKKASTWEPYSSLEGAQQILRQFLIELKLKRETALVASNATHSPPSYASIARVEDPDEHELDPLDDSSVGDVTESQPSPRPVAASTTSLAPSTAAILAPTRSPPRKKQKTTTTTEETKPDVSSDVDMTAAAAATPKPTQPLAAPSAAAASSTSTIIRPSPNGTYDDEVVVLDADEQDEEDDDEEDEAASWKRTSTSTGKPSSSLRQFHTSTTTSSNGKRKKSTEVKPTVPMRPMRTVMDIVPLVPLSSFPPLTTPPDRPTVSPTSLSVASLSAAPAMQTKSALTVTITRKSSPSSSTSSPTAAASAPEERNPTQETTPTKMDAESTSAATSTANGADATSSGRSRRHASDAALFKMKHGKQENFAVSDAMTPQQIEKLFAKSGVDDSMKEEEDEEEEEDVDLTQSVKPKKDAPEEKALVNPKALKKSISPKKSSSRKKKPQRPKKKTVIDLLDDDNDEAEEEEAPDTPIYAGDVTSDVDEDEKKSHTKKRRRTASPTPTASTNVSVATDEDSSIGHRPKRTAAVNASLMVKLATDSIVSVDELRALFSEKKEDPALSQDYGKRRRSTTATTLKTTRKSSPSSPSHHFPTVRELARLTPFQRSRVKAAMAKVNAQPGDEIPNAPGTSTKVFAWHSKPAAAAKQPAAATASKKKEEKKHADEDAMDTEDDAASEPVVLDPIERSPELDYNPDQIGVDYIASMKRNPDFGNKRKLVAISRSPMLYQVKWDDGSETWEPDRILEDVPQARRDWKKRLAITQWRSDHPGEYEIGGEEEQAAQDEFEFISREADPEKEDQYVSEPGEEQEEEIDASMASQLVALVTGADRERIASEHQARAKLQRLAARRLSKEQKAKEKKQQQQTAAALAPSSSSEAPTTAPVAAAAASSSKKKRGPYKSKDPSKEPKTKTKKQPRTSILTSTFGAPPMHNAQQLQVGAQPPRLMPVTSFATIPLDPAVVLRYHQFAVAQAQAGLSQTAGYQPGYPPGTMFVMPNGGAMTIGPGGVALPSVAPAAAAASTGGFSMYDYEDYAEEFSEPDDQDDTYSDGQDEFKPSKKSASKSRGRARTTEQFAPITPGLASLNRLPYYWRVKLVAAFRGGAPYPQPPHNNQQLTFDLQLIALEWHTPPMMLAMNTIARNMKPQKIAQVLMQAVTQQTPTTTGTKPTTAATPTAQSSDNASLANLVAATNVTVPLLAASAVPIAPTPTSNSSSTAASSLQSEVKRKPTKPLDRSSAPQTSISIDSSATTPAAAIVSTPPLPDLVATSAMPTSSIVSPPPTAIPPTNPFTVGYVTTRVLSPSQVITPQMMMNQAVARALNSNGATSTATSNTTASRATPPITSPDSATSAGHSTTHGLPVLPSTAASVSLNDE